MCPHQDVDVTGPGEAWGPSSHLMNVVGCEIEALERTHSPLSWWTERSQNGFCLPQPLRVLSTVSNNENGERMAAQKGPTVWLITQKNPMFGSEYNALFTHQREQF